MCGISLIISGVEIIGSDLFTNNTESFAQQEREPVLQIDNLKDVIQRRGPESLGYKNFFLHSKHAKFIEKEDEDKENGNDCIVSSVERASPQDGKVEILGATLQHRGLTPVFQPWEDFSGNILAYNGEIFGGIHIACDCNDGQALLRALGMPCSCQSYDLDSLVRNCCGNTSEYKSVPEILSTIRGPWALIYWQEKTKTIWFGRDAFGRRSLLVHWPTVDDSRLVLSSVSTPSSSKRGSDYDVADTHNYWEELPCGIYSIQFRGLESNELSTKEKIWGQAAKHAWADSLLDTLIKWERTNVDPRTKEKVLDNGFSLQKKELQPVTDGNILKKYPQSGSMQPAQRVLIALRESVMRRTAMNINVEKPQDEHEELVPIALLFSGGLDSMILAALLDQCLDPKYIIDLLNISFDGQLAPDRVSARMGVKELQNIAPSRRWRLVEIDSALSSLIWETKHVMSLIHPAKTYMDLNIGIALWLAAKGDGWVDGEICTNLNDNICRYQYKSKSRILFVGSGADEQCAGYGRHKTKYRHGGWSALQEEMRLDVQRIWKRNLGRDDRCISDHGKEARFPFLDEDVIKTLLEIPLWEIADLDEPSGRGDKKILREVACLLGIEGASILPKRAIQFGSRIARESNRKTFGSNRAANQASAGSVNIFEAL